MAREFPRTPLVAAEDESHARVAELRDLPLDDRFRVGLRIARLVGLPALLDLRNERSRHAEIRFGIVHDLRLRSGVRAVQQIVGADRWRPVERRSILHALTQAG